MDFMAYFNVMRLFLDMPRRILDRLSVADSIADGVAQPGKSRTPPKNRNKESVGGHKRD